MQRFTTILSLRPNKRAFKRYARFICLLGVAAFVMAPCAMRAQIAGTANVQGTVSDATGAVVARQTWRLPMRRRR